MIFQSYLYYDVYAASQQTAFVCAGLFARYMSQLVSAAYCDVPHRAALHLGRWRHDDTCTGIPLTYYARQCNVLVMLETYMSVVS